MFRQHLNLEAFGAANIGAEDVAKVPETAVVEAASGTVSPEDWIKL